MSSKPSEASSVSPTLKPYPTLRAFVIISIVLDSLEVPDDPDLLDQVKNNLARAFDNYLPKGARVKNVDLQYLINTNSQTAEFVMNRYLQNSGIMIVTLEKDFDCETENCTQQQENVDDLVTELHQILSDALSGELNSEIQSTIENDAFGGDGDEINIQVGETFSIQDVETKIIDLRRSPSPSAAMYIPSSLPTSKESTITPSVVPTSSSLPCSMICHGDSTETFRIHGIKGWRKCGWVTSNPKLKEARCAYPEVLSNCCKSCCSS